MLSNRTRKGSEGQAEAEEEVFIEIVSIQHLSYQ
jgi:hypothetical protein